MARFKACEYTNLVKRSFHVVDGDNNTFEMERERDYVRAMRARECLLKYRDVDIPMDIYLLARDRYGSHFLRPNWWMPLNSWALSSGIYTIVGLE